MDKKYELIPSDIEGLFRIKALKDFNDVKNGDIGGYVESEKNLSQYDDCWIYDNAIVQDNAVVIGKAIVCGNARVYDNAQIWGNAKVEDNAQIYDNAVVMSDAKVCGNARVRNNAQVCDNAIVRDDARVFANAQIYDNAVVVGNARVCDNAEIGGKARIGGNAVIQGNAEVSGDAIISSDKDYIVFKNWWSSGRYFTWTRSNNMWKVGCFYGTGEQLIAKAYKDSEESGREYERIVKYVEREDKPSEWGIEDEKNIMDCIFYLENAKKYFEKDDNILFNEKWFNLCIKSLKSLKRRIEE